MIIPEYKGINSFLVGVARYLLENAVKRSVRGFNTFEINHPVIFRITNPLARHITIPERGWNHILPYAESLWIASGRNDMNLIGKYLKKLYDYSDDLVSMRAAYGPRLRYYNGSPKDYYKHSNHSEKKVLSGEVIEIDQFDFIEKAFQRDPFTRQGIITITDPVKDYFQGESNILKTTKDFPCTNNLHFVRKGDCLDLYLHMRSNDFFWGATGVNIFNFTFIQEYFSKILGLKVGNYYHMVNNLHYYEQFSDKIRILANIQNFSEESYEYKYSFNNLTSFDTLVAKLENYESALSEKSNLIFESDDDFFNDWAKVLYSFHNKDLNIEFNSPVLNSLHKLKQKNKN
jgi:thymidylate synthase